MPPLSDSYRRCRDIARSQGKNFYYTFQVLPRRQRMSMYAIYAFMRLSDDISDEPGDRHAQEKRFASWRRKLDDVYAGETEDDCIFPAFQDTVRRYHIPKRYFHEVIDGTAMDLTRNRYETFEQLYRYCYKVASVVGLVCIHVFGFHGEEALGYAEDTGIAFQLTNIIRDVREDAERGRIYLPKEDLRRFDYPEEKLLAGDINEQFTALIKFQVDRARGYYQKSQPLFDYIHKRSHPALLAMRQVYGGILDGIETCGYDVYHHRPNPSTARKALILSKLFCRKWLPGAVGRG